MNNILIMDGQELGIACNARVASDSVGITCRLPSLPAVLWTHLQVDEQLYLSMAAYLRSRRQAFGWMGRLSVGSKANSLLQVSSRLESDGRRRRTEVV